MKNTLKTIVPFFIGLFLVSVIASCDQDDSTLKSSLTDQAQLIEAIQSSTNKSAVTIDELPGNTNIALESEYSESYPEEALYAQGLGYEVTIRRNQGSQMGELNQAYFDESGNELNASSANQNRGKNSTKGNAEVKGKDRNECFDFVFPVTFVLPDGSEITASDRESLKTSVQEFYEANPGLVERPTIQFPMDVVFEDGTTQTISSEDEMEALHLLCGEGNGKGKGQGSNNEKVQGQKGNCFELVLPVTHLMPDGTEIVVSDSSDRELIRVWYEANPEVTEKSELQFPVEIILADGSSQTIADSEELEALRALCRESNRAQNRCFEMQFPVTRIMPDGTEIVVNDSEDRDAIKAWYQANPDSKERPELVFPVTVVYDDESIITVNDSEELKALHEECKQENQG